METAGVETAGVETAGVETTGTSDGTTEGRIAGYVLLLFNAGTSLARIYSFAVDPDFRRTGVAFRLLDAAEREARDHECVYIRLEVRRDNEPAINLYRRTGYREFGIRRIITPIIWRRSALKNVCGRRPAPAEGCPI